MKKNFIFPLAIFIAGLCSIIYELQISTVSSYFLGDSVKQFVAQANIMPEQIPKMWKGKDRKLRKPHDQPARPWRLAKPEPMLRCIRDAGELASLLHQSWALATGKVICNVQATGETMPENPTDWQLANKRTGT